MSKSRWLQADGAAQGSSAAMPASGGGSGGTFAEAYEGSRFLEVLQQRAIGRISSAHRAKCGKHQGSCLEARLWRIASQAGHLEVASWPGGKRQ